MLIKELAFSFFRMTTTHFSFLNITVISTELAFTRIKINAVVDVCSSSQRIKPAHLAGPMEICGVVEILWFKPTKSTVYLFEVKCGIALVQQP